MKSPVPTAVISMSTDNLTDCISFIEIIIRIDKSWVSEQLLFLFFPKSDL